MRLAFFLALATAAGAQQLTFTPQPAVRGLKATVWGVSACGAPAGTVTPGVVARALIQKGVSPLTHDSALDLIHRHSYLSPWQQAVKWGGTVVSLGGAAVQFNWVSARPNVRDPVTYAVSLLNLVLPAIAANAPPPDSIERNLLSGPVQVPGDGCAEFVVLSGRTKAQPFIVEAGR